MIAETLRTACKGPVIASGEAGFPEALHGNLWNRLIPDRAPQLIVKAADEDDIIAAITFARANGLKVVVRGGGHNWCQPTLRNGGILIDLGSLDRIISIDVENRRAVIQPIVSNRAIQKALNAHGLAFPTGHCPQVKASGYFLGGGMAWNPTVWGYGAESLEAIELVTAQGTLIRASETENADFFWAARAQARDSSVSSPNIISSFMRCPKRYRAVNISIASRMPRPSARGSARRQRASPPASS